tara:strand:+ start:1167 stop:1601 length:435 start_codon:yes stop_codon:yes gene_type:complete
MGPVKTIILLTLIFTALIILFFYLNYFVISLIILILLLGSLIQLYLEFFTYKRFIKVKLKELIPRVDHNRVSFGDKLSNSRNGILYNWDKLHESIKSDGLKNPLRVKRTTKGYVIVDGHHRFRVLKELYDENYEIKVTIINKMI